MVGNVHMKIFTITIIKLILMQLISTVQFEVMCFNSQTLATNMIRVHQYYSYDGSGVHQVKCTCPYGTYDANGLRCYISSSIFGCLAGTGTDDTNLNCKICGYGLTLTSPTTCQCLGYSVAGGCSSNPGCNLVKFQNYTSQTCLSCKQSFQLINGQCFCPQNQIYNNSTQICQLSSSQGSTTLITTIQGCLIEVNSSYCSVCGFGLTIVNGTCVCQDYTVTGGCTSIEGCNFISYSSGGRTEICIGCKSSFTLLNGICVCSTGTYYDNSTTRCETYTASSSPSPQPSPSTSQSKTESSSENTNWLSVAQMTTIEIILGVVCIILIIFVIYLLYKVHGLSKTISRKQISPTSNIYNQQINQSIHDKIDRKQKMNMSSMGLQQQKGEQKQKMLNMESEANEQCQQYENNSSNNNEGRRKRKNRRQIIETQNNLNDEIYEVSIEQEQPNNRL